MSNNRIIPVWQLTDGTVIVQGDEAVAQAIKEKRFRWQATDGVSSQRNVPQRLAHWLYLVLEKI